MNEINFTNRNVLWFLLHKTENPELKRIIMSYNLTKPEADFIENQLLKIKAEITTRDDEETIQDDLF